MSGRWWALATLVTGLWASPALGADKAQDFTLRDVNGQEVSLSQYKGQVVVVDFWATWCGPCKVELPHLEKMYQDKKAKGFVVLTISTDDARTASQVKPFVARSGYTFPVLLDKDSSVVTRYNPAKTLPYTVIIDRDGNVAKVHSGYNPGDEKDLEAAVDGLL